MYHRNLSYELRVEIKQALDDLLLACDPRLANPWPTPERRFAAGKVMRAICQLSSDGPHFYQDVADAIGR